jgi:hypothetical protein
MVYVQRPRPTTRPSNITSKPRSIRRASNTVFVGEIPGRRSRTQARSLGANIARPRIPNVQTIQKNGLASATRPQSGLTTNGQCPQGLLKVMKLELIMNVGRKKVVASK